MLRGVGSPQGKQVPRSAIAGTYTAPALACLPAGPTYRAVASLAPHSSVSSAVMRRHIGGPVKSIFMIQRGLDLDS